MKKGGARGFQKRVDWGLGAFGRLASKMLMSPDLACPEGHPHGAGSDGRNYLDRRVILAAGHYGYFYPGLLLGQVAINVQ
jgi:hypothetical protein